MLPKLYNSLASWWHLLSDPRDYTDEAERYWQLMSDRSRQPIDTMLELGSGGGNNASHFKHHCRMTVSDLSPDMLAQSCRINPECEHVEGDMRTLRLGRRFNAVFVHDAVMYMVTESDLLKVMETAVAHCMPGGVVMFVADYTRETWAPTTCHGGRDAADRALRYLQWTWDPDPKDTEYVSEMVYVLREGDKPIRIERDQHRFGLFPRETWLRLMAQAGICSMHLQCQFIGGEEAGAFMGTVES
jgi:SAM-dependent methyltransferase